jgi:hypothetical protein
MEHNLGDTVYIPLRVTLVHRQTEDSGRQVERFNISRLTDPVDWAIDFVSLKQRLALITFAPRSKQNRQRKGNRSIRPPRDHTIDMLNFFQIVQKVAGIGRPLIAPRLGHSIRDINEAGGRNRGHLALPHEVLASQLEITEFSL